MADASNSNGTDGIGTPDTTSSFDVIHAPIGLSDPQYSARKRKMLDAVIRLRAIGANIDLDIPVIVVLGSQSAGKSSLIEAISGITLPRASGTCTRCPTECQLYYSSEPWRCVVSLRLVTDEDGTVLGQPRRVEFGDPIFDKHLVTERIRRAQSAILNPATPPTTFLNESTDDLEERQLSFSSNSVCLEIRGRDIDDLSFVDLPGLIPGGDPRDSKLVQQLAESYICKESCIILLTIACETDYENQGAHRLAAQYDPHGSRTIGVLTKPDRIPTGEEGSWIRMIQGQHDIDGEETGIEYFSVKNPDSQDIKHGISYEQARQKEAEFYSTKEPWSQLDWPYQQRLGTKKLTGRLSEALPNLISKRQVFLEGEVNKQLDRTNNEISRLPSPPSSEPVGEMLRLIGLFVRSIEHLVDGTPDDDGLIQALRGPRVDFKKAICQTAPDFRPSSGDRDMYALLVLPLPRPSFLLEEEVDWQEDAKGVHTAIFIEDVENKANSAVTRELPNNIPFIVKKRFIADIVGEWDAPSKKLFHTTVKELNKRIKEQIEVHFTQYTHGHLKQRVMNIMHAHTQRRANATEQRINFLLEEEQEPFTMNEHHFMEHRSKFLGYYRGIRQKDEGGFVERLRSRDRDTKIVVNKVISGLAELGQHSVEPASLARLLPPDPMETAIEIMSEVQAYFQVSYRRFVDNVPMTIDRSLLRGLKVGLESALFTGMDISGPEGHERCKMLLSEPENIVARRMELQNRRDRLGKAKRELLHAFE
ncbi:P-loop containing nucleoside triphosphate hydrolase protein [Russula earlei]|uniref:P-loop containing nucleoside triphosphate hydrolase protein n=1 Tax=Russula earlei TaxID=71964 RepID=A0ACC0TXN3_9AGAM|nr:P-loop containing nucleoside triphosphate hydrolase protein [Russula earlei]